jgi:hypothetical protein
MPRLAAYSRILSAWFSVEYCWCSVDIRTYSTARSKAGDAAGVLSGPSCCMVPDRSPDLKSWRSGIHRCLAVNVSTGLGAVYERTAL